MTYPDDWTHQPAQDAEAFAPKVDLQTLDDGVENAGQLLVRAEWNWERQSIEPLWTRHIGMLAGLLGAKDIGSAPWKIGKSTGLEAEIVLPKKDPRRLWVGILTHDFRVLQFMATHPKEAREQFEPVASKIISSLRFPNRMLGINVSPEGLPLPPGYVSVDPNSLLTDIAEIQQWRAFAGKAGIGALQAFYLRELPVHNWEIEEYLPFPGPAEPGFARLRVRRDTLRVTLGLLPYAASETGIASSLANIVFKVSSP